MGDKFYTELDTEPTLDLSSVLEMCQCKTVVETNSQQVEQWFQARASGSQPSLRIYSVANLRPGAERHVECSGGEAPSPAWPKGQYAEGLCKTKAFKALNWLRSRALLVLCPRPELP